MLVGQRRTSVLKSIKFKVSFPSLDVSVDVVMVDGHKCICINPWASYGGGSLPLWAVEGHDAQLTVRKPNALDGYIRGTCIKINEETQMIEFKASVPYGNTTKFEILQLCLEEIGRYDTNWR